MSETDALLEALLEEIENKPAPAPTDRRAIVDLAHMTPDDLTEDERRAVLSMAGRIVRKRPPTEAQKTASAKNSAANKTPEARAKMQAAQQARRERERLEREGA